MFITIMFSFLAADYCVVAVLVSFGALVGKISLAQVITMATIEVIIQCFNEYICTYFLMVCMKKNYFIYKLVFLNFFISIFRYTMLDIQC